MIADVSGENREYPLGEEARGLLIYSPDGFMSVQISRPGRPAYADGALHGGTDAQRAAAAAEYLAYAGRYSGQGDVVTHKPLASLLANWEGFDVPRRARITGETLTLDLLEPIHQNLQTMRFKIINAVAWEKPDPPPNALHTAFTHLKTVEAIPPPREPRAPGDEPCLHRAL